MKKKTSEKRLRVEDCEDCCFLLEFLLSHFLLWMSFRSFRDVVLDFSTKNLWMHPTWGLFGALQGPKASLPRRATHEFGGKAPRSAAADGAGRKHQHDGRPSLRPRNTWERWRWEIPASVGNFLGYARRYSIRRESDRNRSFWTGVSPMNLAKENMEFQVKKYVMSTKLK